MKSTLHTVRVTTSFSARWYLVPLALCALAIVTAVVAQMLAPVDAAPEAGGAVPVAGPAQVDAQGT
jgi:hypothetical protein